MTLVKNKILEIQLDRIMILRINIVILGIVLLQVYSHLRAELRMHTSQGKTKFLELHCKILYRFLELYSKF